ncbi:MAG TPA: DUF4272 domain-containing protein [Blastocatellia bacterium]|jgi:hypothetical protein|nr:DUF4272 domain-containing protein [Blastocatellia bacterium]
MTRKERSDQKLKQLGIPVNAHLPRIESEEKAQLRNPEAVAQRAIALCAVAVRGEGLEWKEVAELLKEHNPLQVATPKEKSFLLEANPTQQDRFNFSWRYESLWVLLWALGYVESLGYPSSHCDVPRAVETLTGASTEQFIMKATLRPLSEILDEADLIYRYDWAVVDARINGQPPPANLDEGVVYERHYALNWLIGYMNQDWDDVTTDT